MALPVADSSNETVLFYTARARWRYHGVLWCYLLVVCCSSPLGYCIPADLLLKCYDLLVAIRWIHMDLLEEVFHTWSISHICLLVAIFCVNLLTSQQSHIWKQYDDKNDFRKQNLWAKSTLVLQHFACDFYLRISIKQKKECCISISCWVYFTAITTNILKNLVNS